MSNYFQSYKYLTLLFVFCTFGCASSGTEPVLQIEQLRTPKPESVLVGNVEENRLSEMEVLEGPSSGYESKVATAAKSEAPNLPSGEFKGAYNNMRIAAFINEIFGNQLGLSFVVDASVQTMDELVSLRLVDEISAERLFEVARETLANYGVSISARDFLYTFSISDEATGDGIPLVVTGRALPDVPAGHRPMFMFVPIDVVDSNMLRGWLNTALKGQGLQIQAVRNINALLLQGKHSTLEHALEIIDLLDQPANRGNYSSIIEPVYTDAKELAKDLERVLLAQGYDANGKPPLGSVMVLPMRGTNQIVLLASSRRVLDHAITWSKILDRQTTADISDGVFSYQVRNTDVEYLVNLLNDLNKNRSSSGGSGENNAKRSARDAFIADVNRNAVVYRGQGKDWVDLLPAIREMDVPTPSVLVEVILAEVTLNDQDETGFEFIARSGEVTFSTLGGIGIGSSGLTATLNRAGETRAVLNAFYQNDRANIRSRPRLMVKSGQLARIDVGNEIPFVTSTSQSTENPDAPVIQTVNYRKTGVILQIEPVVHSSGYVDIRISQELSEAQQTSTSSIDSPTIFNRKLETTVTLRDGGSVLLGGLISESKSDSDNGIKGLGRIPGVGRLFRSDSSSSDKTELVMMVIPYVIENPDEAAEITGRALEFLKLTR